MVRRAGSSEGDETGGATEPLRLPDPSGYREAYYAGKPMISPMGGRLEPLTVRLEDDGSGTVILECSSSSLRYALTIPPGSRSERRKVKEWESSEGLEPRCPRHGKEVRLVRKGDDLACPRCGARFGRFS